MMKKKIVMTVAALAASVLTLTGCGSDKDASAAKPLGDITSDVVACGVDFPDMVEVEEENFQIKYGLAADDYEEYSLKWAGSGADADEICIIKAKDAEKVKNAVSKRIDSQKNVFKDYAPEQYDKLCKAKVRTKGNYVYWVCTNDNSKSEKPIEDSIK